MDLTNIQYNEADRIEELKTYRIKEIEEKQDFDFITAMAAKICNTKISLISLVYEDYQWFLSHHGIQTQATSLDFSFCADTIKSPQIPFIVENAMSDERFAGNPYLAHTQMVFYAGIPLVSSKGIPLGSLCVIDYKPKTLTAEQIDLLTKLAKQVTTLFELRKKQGELDAKNKKLEETNHRLEIIQKANQIGVWELDLKSNTIFWSQEVYDIHELPHNTVVHLEKGINFYHADYKKLITEATENAIKYDIPFDLITVLITDKKNLKWVRSVGKRVGQKLIGSFQDITDIKKRELKFEGIFNSTMSFIGFLDTTGTLLEINTTALELGGLTKEDVVGKPLWECYWWQIATETQNDLIRHFQKALTGQEIVYEVDINVAHKMTSTILFSLRPLLDDQGKIIYIIAEGRQIDELTKTRDHFTAVLEGTNAGTFEWNIQTGKKKYDERWANIAGYTLSELEPISEHTWTNLAHPDDVLEAGKKIKRLFEKKELFYEMEARIKHKQGHWIWTLNYGKIIEWTPEGLPSMMYGTHQDITLRKQKALKLSYQKQILNALYELSPIGISLNDHDTGKFVDGNDKLIEPTGYTKEEFKELTYWDVTPTPYEALEKTALIELKEKGYYNKIEKEYIKKDGSRYPVSLQGILIEDLNGKKLIWSFVQDISAEKKAEERIYQAMNNLRAVLHATDGVAIIASDEKGTITLFNSGAEKMLGYKASELIGIQNHLVMHMLKEIEENSIELSQQYSQNLTGFEALVFETKMNNTITKEWTFKRKDGQELPVLLSIKAVKNNSKITGYSAVAVDISILKKAENDIKNLLGITQDKNSRLRNFAYIVSHNLRSHSIGLSGILDLMKLESPDLYANELISLVDNGVENLRQTVDDLTEVVKVNLIQNIVVDIPLFDAIQKNIELVALQCKEANFEIKNLVPKEVSAKGVPAYIDSIALNFITNALKYRDQTKQSFLKIYSIVDQEHLIICFEDNGLGINLKQHSDKLFGMYKTFHQNPDSKGLGLFITKNQVVSMNGKIEVDSEENVGTTFKVFLPL
jgi:PAS domain S-box-containing protein